MKRIVTRPPVPLPPPESHWLYQRLLAADPSLNPQKALLSTLHWAKALRFEIERVYADSPDTQFERCLKTCRSRSMLRAGNVEVARVFDPLFRALMFATSALSLELRGAVGPWAYLSAVVTWYYAYYHAVRAMLQARGLSFKDTHSSVLDTLPSIRPSLPYPLNMVATRAKADKYAPRFDDYPNLPRYAPNALQDPFGDSQESAQGVLLQYLSGTADYYAARVNERTKERHKFFKGVPAEERNFRKKEARTVRDEELGRALLEVHFMHCAYRYRGKANYRDAIYIPYGKRSVEDISGEPDTFVHDLAVSARFAFICGLAYVAAALGRPRVGLSEAALFLQDLRINVRGRDQALPGERFGEGLAVE